MDKDFKSQLTSDSQNAREAGGYADLLDRWWADLNANSSFGDKSLITKDQLAGAMCDSALLAIDECEAIEARADVGRSVTLLALAHSLEGMGARADEVGMGGNAFIARQAAAFVAKIEKSVTRLLPEGQLVRHASLDFDVAVGGIDIGPRGEMRVICYRPDWGEDWWSLPVDELEVVYEIKSEAECTAEDRAWPGDPLYDGPLRVVAPPECSLGPITHVTIGGRTFDVEEGPSASPGPFTLPDETVHHLSVDPDQVVTLHGAWAERGDDQIYVGEGQWTRRDGSGGGGSWPPSSNEPEIGTVRRSPSYEDWRPHEIGGMPAPHPVAWPKWIKRFIDWAKKPVEIGRRPLAPPPSESHNPPSRPCR
jgi:hypothetical protein